MEKVILSSIAALLILISVGMFFTTNSIQSNAIGQMTAQNNPTMQSRMSLSAFDRELAIQMMDKNNDGKCDACGMPVEMCIDSGQMECNMDSNAKIGVLGSQHIHADWKVYMDGEPLDLFEYSHMGRMQQGLSVSSFIHVDSGSPKPEKTGDVLHMHATGVPLWIFFKSLDMELPENMNAYVNGKEIQDFQNYVFNDLDKILITDGVGNMGEQLDSITSFAGNH